MKLVWIVKVNIETRANILNNKKRTKAQNINTKKKNDIE